MITCVITIYVLRLRQTFTVWKISFATISFHSGLFDTLFFDKRGQYKIWDQSYGYLARLVLYDFALFNGLVLKLNIPNSKRTVPSHISF